ncbi:MAG: lactate utilization protein [Nitrososphaerales archaeon]
MNLYQKFKEELENLGGNVYSIQSIDEAVRFIKKLIAENGIKKVALARLEKKIENLLYDGLKDSVEVIRALELKENFKEVLDKVDLGITDCDLALANTGTIILSCRNELERLVTALPTIHLVIFNKDKIVKDLEDTLEFFSRILEEYPLSITFISGPSKTADILGQLVKGAHGPRKVLALVLD